MYKKGLILIFILLISISSSIYAEKWEMGDQGNDVKKIQQYLFEMGYDINVDGIYGYGTKEVVQDFQFNNNLNVDGIVGEKTFQRMEDAIKDITYIVKKGDTLSAIALKYDTTVKDIEEKNSIKSDLIRVGQKLKISKTGIGGGEDRNIYSTIYHKVNPGDVLSVISKKYGVDIETIKLANKLKNDTIYVGQDLLIPHLKRDVNKPFTLQKGVFIWPVMGRISSPFGYRIHPISRKKEFHNGIDIAVPLGTPIRAAASGTVIQSGYINGFGKTVIIDHGDGIRTLYGHNSRLLVRAGAKVNLGQIISLAGSTGKSTGSHLHFSIYDHKKNVNPMKYLP